MELRQQLTETQTIDHLGTWLSESAKPLILEENWSLSKHSSIRSNLKVIIWGLDCQKVPNHWFFFPSNVSENAHHSQGGSVRCDNDEVHHFCPKKTMQCNAKPLILKQLQQSLKQSPLWYFGGKEEFLCFNNDKQWFTLWGIWGLDMALTADVAITSSWSLNNGICWYLLWILSTSRPWPTRDPISPWSVTLWRFFFSITLSSIN